MHANESPKYKAAKMECKKQLKKDKNAYFQNQCETLNKSNKNDLYFRVIKGIFKKKNVKSVGMINKNGHLVTEKDQILKVWEDFYKGLYENKDTTNNEHQISNHDEQPIPPILLDEVIMQSKT